MLSVVINGNPNAMESMVREDLQIKPAIFFDLGNTLLYYQGDRVAIELEAYQALAQSLSTSGIPIPTKKFLKRFQNVMQSYYRRRTATLVEETTIQQLLSVLKEFGQENVPCLILRKALDQMYRITEPHWQLDPDTHASLNLLRTNGFQLGLISNASDSPNAFRLLRRNKLYSYFSTILISSVVGFRKPHPQIFLSALQTCSKTNGNHTYMVGDLMSTDIMGGSHSGMRTVWLSKHADPLDEIESDPQLKPDLIFSSLAGLAAWMQEKYASI
jgi:putative hydrolase of the HAD superfamily